MRHETHFMTVHTRRLTIGKGMCQLQDPRDRAGLKSPVPVSRCSMERRGNSAAAQSPRYVLSDSYDYAGAISSRKSGTWSCHARASAHRDP